MIVVRLEKSYIEIADSSRYPGDQIQSWRKMRLGEQPCHVTTLLSSTRGTSASGREHVTNTEEKHLKRKYFILDLMSSEFGVDQF